MEAEFGHVGLVGARTSSVYTEMPTAAQQTCARAEARNS
jgi:hypothetical protein